MKSYAEKCTDAILVILKNVLSKEQLDMLAAAIAYDTEDLHDGVAVAAGKENKECQNNCERIFQSK